MMPARQLKDGAKNGVDENRDRFIHRKDREIGAYDRLSGDMRKTDRINSGRYAKKANRSPSRRNRASVIYLSAALGTVAESAPERPA